jgi:hypothetical protein
MRASLIVRVAACIATVAAARAATAQSRFEIAGSVGLDSPSLGGGTGTHGAYGVALEYSARDKRADGERRNGFEMAASLAYTHTSADGTPLTAGAVSGFDQYVLPSVSGGWHFGDLSVGLAAEHRVELVLNDVTEQQQVSVEALRVRYPFEYSSSAGPYVSFRLHRLSKAAEPAVLEARYLYRDVRFRFRYPAAKQAFVRVEFQKLHDRTVSFTSTSGPLPLEIRHSQLLLSLGLTSR